ncbi:MAG TPA: hypothetical protein VF815_34300 [Myxococcaceae bacterium]|jgi:hypothetical protein
MRPWQLLWRVEALLLAVMIGCSGTPQVVRVETRADGETLLYIPRTETVEPVTVPAREVTETLRRMARDVRLTGTPRETVDRLLGLDPQYGNYLYLLGERKLVPQGAGMPLEGALTPEEQQLVSRYKAWCLRTHGYEGDCLGGALVEGKYLDMRGRYLWAMAMSKSPVLEEFEQALGQMVSLQAVMQAALCAIVTLLVLLAMPEPVTKLVAAWATVALIVWVGASTLYNLITGWFELMKEVKKATTFEQLREAGERFGRLFSREAAQAFALIAMALLTHTAKGFGEQMATLPGSAQVDAGGGPGGAPVVGSDGGRVGGGDVRGLPRGTAATRGGDGGPGASEGQTEPPHRDHRQQEVHYARRPMDASVRAALRQGRHEDEGH